MSGRGTPGLLAQGSGFRISGARSAGRSTRTPFAILASTTAMPWAAPPPYAIRLPPETWKVRTIQGGLPNQRFLPAHPAASLAIIGGGHGFRTVRPSLLALDRKRPAPAREHSAQARGHMTGRWAFALMGRVSGGRQAQHGEAIAPMLAIGSLEVPIACGERPLHRQRSRPLAVA